MIKLIGKKPANLMPVPAYRNILTNGDQTRARLHGALYPVGTEQRREPELVVVDVELVGPRKPPKLRSAQETSPLTL